MFLALNSIYIGIVRMLYVFDISRAMDEYGQQIIPEVEYDGFIRSVPFPSNHASLAMHLPLCSLPCSHPRPFRCSNRPRSKEAEELIRREV